MTTTLYGLLGEDEGIRALVDRFYDEMDQNPAAKQIRDMHAKDLKSSREKLFLFLCGWTGGPQRYVERYGHPRLRRRHFPFAIDSAARDQWMLCMDIALSECALNDALREKLREAFANLADHIRNTEDA